VEITLIFRRFNIKLLIKKRFNFWDVLKKIVTYTKVTRWIFDGVKTHKRLIFD